MQNQYHAKTLKGLEPVLARELEATGATNIRPVNRGVDFSGSKAVLYKANMMARTALRILVPVSRFRAQDDDALYRLAQKIDWSEYLTYKNSFAVDAVTFSNIFRNSHFVELRVKDAIVDQFKEKTGFRPSVNTAEPEIRINVHVAEDRVTISLDSSGESLHKRGYRKEMHRAALSEVLAAGMVLLTGWKGDRTLINPMCGSGTLAIEAAMIATNTYPCITGRSYGFMNWPDFDQILFERLLEGLPEPVPLKFPIIATDIDPEAIRSTKNNIRSLEIDGEFKVAKEDFFESSSEEGALMIINPPYDERLKLDDADDFYRDIGTTLKHHYPGADAWVFSAHLRAVKQIGLKPGEKHTLYNGALECRFLKYSLFKGARKDFLQGNR